MKSQFIHLGPAKKVRTLGLADYVGILSGIALIYAIAIINGHGRIFWEDETLGWVLLRDPSLGHMLRAWKLGADGGGICFYLLGRVWFRCFGDGVLAFRLFSATTFALAVPTLWIILCRFYSKAVVAFAIFNTLFFSPPLTMHYMEGRFYGLLVFATALAFLLNVRLDEIQGELPTRWYVCVFAVHLLLTGSHVLGVMYSALLLLAMVVLDRLRGRSRRLLYLSAASSWLLLLAEMPALRATARVGRPYFWTRPPSLGQVVGAYSVFSPEIFTVLVLLLLAAAAALPRNPQAQGAILVEQCHQRLAIYVTSCSLLLAPVALLLEGLVGTWLFTDRYLQPVAIGIICLTSELLTIASLGLQKRASMRRWPRLAVAGSTAFWLAFGGCLLLWVFRHEARYTPSVPEFTAQLTQHVPQGLPVVVEDAFTFTELMSRPAGSQRPYVFLLDWPYAIGRSAPRMEVTQYHLMENWKKAGYFPSHIADKSSFLRDNACFSVVSNSILGPQPASRPEVGNPIALSLGHTPGYTVQKLYTLDRILDDNERDTIWQVSRGSCGR